MYHLRNKAKYINLSLTRQGLLQFRSFQNPVHDVPELHKIRWSPDLEAPRLWKGSSGKICFKCQIGADTYNIIYPMSYLSSKISSKFRKAYF